MQKTRYENSKQEKAFEIWWIAVTPYSNHPDVTILFQFEKSNIPTYMFYILAGASIIDQIQRK